MRYKKIYILFVLIFILFISMFIFYKNGKDTINQDYLSEILNIESYEIEAKIRVQSNKNENDYTVTQRVENGKCIYQEILSPEELSGLIVKKEDGKVNVKFKDLEYVFEKYNYIYDSFLDLSFFMQKYKENNEENYVENEDDIVLKAKYNINRYINYAELKIDKNSGVPRDLKIFDVNKNNIIYIEYIKVNINNL